MRAMFDSRGNESVTAGLMSIRAIVLNMSVVAVSSWINSRYVNVSSVANLTLELTIGVVWSECRISCGLDCVYVSLPRFIVLLR